MTVSRCCSGFRFNNLFLSFSRSEYPKLTISPGVKDKGILDPFLIIPKT